MRQTGVWYVMRLVFVSDTHNQTAFDVPDGDVLVHCGDGTVNGSAGEIRLWNEWFTKQPHRYKIVIAGNHDIGFEEAPEAAQRLLKTPIYLQDSSINIEGVKFYGSPWTQWFYDWAFNLPPGAALAAKWTQIPKDTDVLITHGPPYGILDINVENEHVGDEELLKVVERLKPKIHAFGHVHYSHGAERRGDTLFVNAAICTDRYDPWQKPIVVDLFEKGAVLV
jgi:Icc-related predicted phosphoesterase